MEIYNQTEDFNVMGVHVTSFPNGIKEAFESLMQVLGGRDYYGISWMDENDNIVYYAMAKESYAGEAQQHNYDIIKIEKGEYLSEAIQDWMSKTDCIKDVLHNLMGKSKPDKDHFCIEWYRSDEEMLCLIKKND